MTKPPTNKIERVNIDWLNQTKYIYIYNNKKRNTFLNFFLSNLKFKFDSKSATNQNI